MLLFDSKKKLKEKFRIVFSRYWLSILFAASLAVLSVVEVYDYAYKAPLSTYAFILSALTVLSLAISMLYTTLKVTRMHQLVHYLVLACSGVVFYLLLELVSYQHAVYRYAAIGAFCLAMFVSIPFLFNKDNKDFLAHVKTILINYLLIGVFNIIVFICAAIVFGIVAVLFEVSLDNFKFMSIIYAAWSVFVYVFFVSLFPENFVKINENKFWNKLVNFVTAYVFVPFSVIYSILIYIYSISVVVKWQIPVNKVVWFLMAMYALVFIGYMLLFESSKKSYKWIKKFLRIFILACSPLLVVYFVAIGSRVMAHGLTVNRLYVLSAGLLFLSLTVYFGINKKVQLKLIPIVVGVFVLLSVFGPWSFVNIEKYSQVARYEQFLIDNEFIIDGQVNEELKVPFASALYADLNHNTNEIKRKYGVENVNKFFPEIVAQNRSVIKYYLEEGPSKEKDVQEEVINPDPGAFYKHYNQER